MPKRCGILCAEGGGNVMKNEKVRKWNIGDVFEFHMAQISRFGIVVGRKTAIMFSSSSYTDSIPKDAQPISLSALGLPSELVREAQLVMLAFRTGTRWGRRKTALKP
jgi:hypothetical protein